MISSSYRYSSKILHPSQNIRTYDGDETYIFNTINLNRNVSFSPMILYFKMERVQYYFLHSKIY